MRLAEKASRQGGRFGPGSDKKTPQVVAANNMFRIPWSPLLIGGVGLFAGERRFLEIFRQGMT